MSTEGSVSTTNPSLTSEGSSTHTTVHPPAGGHTNLAVASLSYANIVPLREVKQATKMRPITNKLPSLESVPPHIIKKQNEGLLERLLFPGREDTGIDC